MTHATRLAGQLPFPPLEMRQLVGRTDDVDFDNPLGAPVFPELSPDRQSTVFDFGCGCGRIARQLIQQKPQPTRYVGIDLHWGMIEWCRRNLAPAAPAFEFLHHDVYNLHFNPGKEKADFMPLPAEDGGFDVVNAISVFTHLTQEQTERYLPEIRRILKPEGVFRATWFFFDRASFPMLHPSQNALYVSHADPGAAVIYDRDWVRTLAKANDLTIIKAEAPEIRGFHWWLWMTPSRPGVQDVGFPAEHGRVAQAFGPELPPEPHCLGLEGDGSQRSSELSAHAQRHFVRELPVLGKPRVGA